MKTATKKSKVTKKTAKKKATMTNLIIIDASGSMSDKAGEVKGGVKELLKQIKKDAIKDKAKLKTSTIVVDFSGQGDFNTLVNINDSTGVEDNLADNYTTRGMTALYDAIGKGFAMVGEKEKNVFVSIVTDGQENDSKEFTHTKVKELIEDKKKLGWTVTFMGTTDMAIRDAQSMGISKGNTMSFADSSRGVRTSQLVMNSARNAYYSNALAMMDEGKMRFGGSLMTETLLETAAKEVEKEEKNDKGIKDKGKLPDDQAGAGSNTGTAKV